MALPNLSTASLGFSMASFSFSTASHGLSAERCYPMGRVVLSENLSFCPLDIVTDVIQIQLLSSILFENQHKSLTEPIT